jgi:hypothetical protein
MSADLGLADARYGREQQRAGALADYRFDDASSSAMSGESLPMAT